MIGLRGRRALLHNLLLLGRELFLQGALSLQRVDARPDVRHYGNDAFKRVARDGAGFGRRGVAHGGSPWKELLVAGGNDRRLDRRRRKLPEHLALSCFVRPYEARACSQPPN